MGESVPSVAFGDAPAADLYACPVRKRYAWQLVRYRPAMKRWIAALHASADGAGDAPLLERLSAMLRDAEKGTHAYAHAFAAAGVMWSDLETRAHLAAFPVLTRGELQAKHDDLFHARLRESDVNEGWLGRTSGSTGEPVRFFMDGESIHFFVAFLRFLWERHALGPLPRAFSTGIVLLCTLPRSSIYQVRLPLLRGTLFRKLHWSEPDAAGELARLQPAIVTGDPDSLARLADAVEAGAKIRPKLIASSAFAMPPELAERLRRLTGAAVVDYYSLAETGPVAWRCRDGVLHVLEPAVVVESVAGELLVTNLRNPLFPLIRYATGDLAGVEETSCGCGTRGRVLVRFEGRLSARFVAADGRRVDPSQLHPLLSALPVRQFQLVQTAEGVRLRYFADAALDSAALEHLGPALTRLLRGPSRFAMERASAPLFRSGEKPIVYRTEVAS